MSEAADAVMRSLAPLLDLGVRVVPIHRIGADGKCPCGDPECEKGGKHPMIGAWPKNASCDPAVVRRWAETTDAFAALCGTALIGGGFLHVLDTDPRGGGEESYAALVREIGHEPETVRSLTGGGGWHDFFVHDVALKKGKAGPGLDFQGVGALAILPSSMHASGNRYAWKRDPANFKLLALPQAVVDRLGRRHQSQRPGASPGEGRNVRATSRAGSLRRKGYTEQQMLATLLQENAQEPAPLGEAEIGNIARSIAKKPPGAPEAPPSRRPVRVAEVLSRPRAAQLSWLLEHFRITRGRPTLLLGPSEAGKTWLLQELALSVAAGFPVCWGGLALTMRGRVVHVDYEQGEEHTAYRYARLAFGLGVDLASIPLELIAEPVKHLDDPGAADDFREFMEGTALLVIDSLRAATPRSKENDSESRAVLDMLRQLSDQTGCVVVVIHHEAKPHPGQSQIYRARGTSGFVDAAGAIIAVSMAAPYRSLRQTKAAAGPHGADHAVLLQDVGSASTVDGLSEGLAIVTKTAATATARTTAEGAARDRVVDYVRDHPRCKKTDALKNVHGDNNVVRVALRNLVSEGRIVVHHEGRAHLLQLDDQEGSQAPSLAGPAEDNLSQAGSGAGCCPPMLAERLRPVRAAPASGSTQTISKFTRPPVSKVNRLCLAPAPHWQRTAQPAGCPPWPGSPPAGPTVLRARSSAPKREAKEAGLARCRSIAPRSLLTRSLRPGGSSAKSPISGLHWPSWRRSFSPGGSQRETRMRPWAC